jgi:hypothetical protein
MTTPYNIPDSDWKTVRRICRRHGIDPLLIVAIGIAETHWFTRGDGLKGNGLGVGSYDSGSTYKYSGVQGQVRRACEILAKRKVTTIIDIVDGKLHSSGKWVNGKYVGVGGTIKWASADTADGGPHKGKPYPWSANVISIYKKLVAGLSA